MPPEIAEPLVYFVTLALLGFVICASAFMRHEMLLLACIPPVFVAAIMGFIMGLYAGDTFGWAPTAASVLLGAAPAWYLARRFKPRDLLVSIYLAWALALVMALIGFGFPDREI
ncbi:MAG TPA: hypothetical protein VHB27_06440 [Rhodopila sp.]|uniref:hypothetical protein n=1 Tax=Rhodopila sp. TaxID=2480087 RepID=UPI002C71EC0C|nr:hypothetical protein [Rhodopila sp.]HVY14845.1 hypothetical protein [Rhodopila sp.]